MRDLTNVKEGPNPEENLFRKQGSEAIIIMPVESERQ
jgi:hypothetical protein